MSLVLATCLSIIGFLSLINIFWPLLSQTEQETESSSELRRLLSLYQEKSRLLLNLEDLDIDSRENKISEPDSQNLRSKLMAEMGAVYKKIDDIESKDSFLASVRKALSEGAK